MTREGKEKGAEGTRQSEKERTTEAHTIEQISLGLRMGAVRMRGLVHTRQKNS